MLFIFQFTDNSGEIFYWNLLNQQVLQKLKNVLEHFRTVLEQACHYHKFNQIDVGKNMAARIGGIMKAPQKALVAVSRWQIWQYYIVWDSE